MYSGADILVGRLKFSESCHKYSNLPIHHQPVLSTAIYLEPQYDAGICGTDSSVAFISGQDWGEQNSVIEP